MQEEERISTDSCAVVETTWLYHRTYLNVWVGLQQLMRRVEATRTGTNNRSRVLLTLPCCDGETMKKAW
jgi:hypothetical protein